MVEVQVVIVVVAVFVVVGGCGGATLSLRDPDETVGAAFETRMSSCHGIRMVSILIFRPSAAT